MTLLFSLRPPAKALSCDVIKSILTFKSPSVHGQLLNKPLFNLIWKQKELNAKHKILNTNLKSETRPLHLLVRYSLMQ